MEVSGGLPRLDVVYPRIEGRDTLLTMPRVDSTFAFGSVQPANSLVHVNGYAARVWPNGGWLAFVPLDTMAREFRIEAISPRGDTCRTVLPFRLLGGNPRITEVAAAHPKNRRLPSRISFSQDHAALRTAPGQAYMLFPPIGSVALADSFINPYFRVRLCEGMHGWVEENSVTLDTLIHHAPRCAVKTIRVYAEDRWTKIEIPLSERILFRLEETSEPGKLTLDLYGASSWINRIDYGARDTIVDEIRWFQVTDDLLRLEITLTAHDLWGYGAAWEENVLVLKIRRPPNLQRQPLKGRTIVLDAGHGGSQPGALGPTRLLEKEPNLKLTLKLKALLEKEGVRVLLTREADSTVELYDRVEFAAGGDGEMLLSLHNNALSDGENPFFNHGSSVYYYQPQSLDLARALHRHLVAATSLPDHGLYYQNLALARPTELLAVLLECAFMIHPEEEDLLRQEEFLDRTAAGIVQGIKEFLRNRRKLQE